MPSGLGTIGSRSKKPSELLVCSTQKSKWFVQRMRVFGG